MKFSLSLLILSLVIVISSVGCSGSGGGNGSVYMPPINTPVPTTTPDPFSPTPTPRPVSTPTPSPLPISTPSPSPIPTPTPVSRIPNIGVYTGKISGTTPFGSFNRNVAIYIGPTVTSVGTTTGINNREVAFISGNPLAVPQIGSINITTNSYVYEQLGIAGTNYTRSRIDNAYVTMNESSGLVAFTLDKNTSFLSQINAFNLASGVTAFAYVPVTGGASLQFSSDGKRITGTIDITGTGLVSPSNGRYQASFSADFVP